MPSDFQIQTIEARHPAGERSHVSHFFLLSLSISHTEGERDGRDANTICNRMHWIILPSNDWFSQFHISGLFYLTYSCLSPSLILPWTLFFLSSLLSFLHFDWKLNVNLFGNFSHSHFYQLMRKTVNICNATAFRWRKCFNLRAINRSRMALSFLYIRTIQPPPFLKSECKKSNHLKQRSTF